MSDLRRVIQLDARRTALVLAVPVLAVLSATVAWQALLPGVAYWDNALAALAFSVRVLGPAAAGFAAWVSLREQRLSYLRSLSARSPATGALLDLLLLSGITLAAYAVAGAVIVFRTLTGDEAGSVGALAVLSGAVTLTLYVTAGYLAARLLPHLAVIPAVITLALLWSMLRQDGAWWGLLPPGVPADVGVFSRLSPGLLAEQTLWSLGAVAALVTGYVLTVTRRAMLALPLAAAVLLTGLATVRLHTREEGALTAAPHDHACRRWPLTVCVHPAMRTALPDIEAAVTPLAARLDGTPGEFSRVEHRPSGDRAAPGRGTVPIHLEDLSPGYEERAAQQITERLMADRSCHPGRAGTAYSALVAAWLLDERPPRIDDATATGVFTGWSEERRRTWLRSNYTDFTACRLTATDFREGALTGEQPDSHSGLSPS